MAARAIYSGLGRLEQGLSVRVHRSFGPVVIWSSRTSSMMVLTVAVMAAHTAAPGSAGWWLVGVVVGVVVGVN